MTLFFRIFLAYLLYIFETYRTPKKPKSKKISFVAGLQKSLHTEKKQQHQQQEAAAAAFEGTKETPITIDTDEKRLKMEEDPSLTLPDGYAGQKRKRQNSTTEGGKRKKIIDEVCLVLLAFIHSFYSPLCRQCSTRICRLLSKTSRNW